MKDDGLREELRLLDLDAMTPMQAMQTLADIKKRIES
jgi:hypothetical protein